MSRCLSLAVFIESRQLPSTLDAFMPTQLRAGRPAAGRNRPRNGAMYQRRTTPSAEELWNFRYRRCVCRRCRPAGRRSIRLSVRRSGQPSMQPPAPPLKSLPARQRVHSEEPDSWESETGGRGRGPGARHSYKPHAPSTRRAAEPSDACARDERRWPRLNPRETGLVDLMVDHGPLGPSAGAHRRDHCRLDNRANAAVPGWDPARRDRPAAFCTSATAYRTCYAPQLRNSGPNRSMRCNGISRRPLTRTILFTKVHCYSYSIRGPAGLSKIVDYCNRTRS